MRKFKINVNGKSYEVEVEEIRDGVTNNPGFEPSQQQSFTQPNQTAKEVTSKPAPKVTQQSPASGIPVSAPMPGTIMSVNVKAGDKVNEGDILCILEAMKMENEIVAPKAGEITSVNVNQGTSVNSGDILVTIG